MNRNAAILVITGLAAGCASAPPVTADLLPPCATHRAEGWRQVSGRGVVVCVPGTWSSGGAASWRGESFFMTGDALSRRVAELQLDIYRTARLMEADGGG